MDSANRFCRGIRLSQLPNQRGRDSNDSPEVCKASILRGAGRRAEKRLFGWPRVGGSLCEGHGEALGLNRGGPVEQQSKLTAAGPLRSSAQANNQSARSTP